MADSKSPVSEPIRLTQTRTQLCAGLKDAISIPPLIEIILSYTFVPRPPPSYFQSFVLPGDMAVQCTNSASIDARDQHGKWFSAVVIGTSGAESVQNLPPAGVIDDPFYGYQPECEAERIRFVRVHYDGFQTRWDEWIPLFPTAPGDPFRLQPRGRFTTPVRSRAPDWIKPNAPVAVYHNGKWLAVTIRIVEGVQIQVVLTPADPSRGVRALKRWFHTGSEDVWSGDPYPSPELIPIPPSTLLLSRSPRRCRSIDES